MKALWQFITQNWKGLAVGSFLAFIAGFAVGHFKGFAVGEAQEKAVTAVAVKNDSDKKVNIREKQNEIRNREPGDAVTVDRLQHHNF